MISAKDDWAKKASSAIDLIRMTQCGTELNFVQAETKGASVCVHSRLKVEVLLGVWHRKLKHGYIANHILSSSACYCQHVACHKC